MKKFLVIFFVLVMAGAAVIGLGMFGIIQIPGLKPMFAKKAAKKTEAPAAKLSALKPDTPHPTPTEDKRASVDAQAAPAPKPATIIDPDKGAKALAKVWDEMDGTAIAAISAKWKDADLAKVLSKMDEDKVAEILAALPSDRASKLSQAMQKQASVVVASPES